MPKRLASLLWLCLAGGIAAQAQPVVTVSPNQLFFSFTTGGAVPGAQLVTVSSPTATPLNGQPAVGYFGSATNWLTAALLSGATPATLNISLNPLVVAGLPPGPYSAQVSINAGVVDPSSQLSVVVFLTVSGAGGGGGGLTSITVSPNQLNFAFIPGGLTPPAQNLAVSLSNNSGVFITATTAVGGNWLIVTPTQLTATPGSIAVTVNPTGLSPGTYSGTVTVTGAQQQTIPVTFTIGISKFSLTPSALNFAVPQNYGISAPQYIQVSTAAPVPFSVFATSTGNWLQVDAPGGITPAVVAVKVNTGGLTQGSYTGTITLQQGPAYSVDVPVTLTVGAPATLSIAPSSVTLVWTVGDLVPLTQTVSVRSSSTTVQSFTAVASVVNGSGWLGASAATGSTPATLTLSVNPTGLAPGTYFGAVTLTPSGTNASPQPISLTLTVLATPTPVITTVQSAASGAPGTVSPGQLVTILGKGVGPKGLVVFPLGSTTVPTTVGSTTVTFNGVAAPVIYASTAATTVQVPYNIVVGQPLSMRVTYVAAQSAEFVVASQAIYPGLFSADATGKGQAAALNQDFSLNSPSNPARRGDVLVLYGTGEGVTTPALATGSLVPLMPPFPRPVVQPVVFFNGQQGTVMYAGEAPGSVSGLFQINVQIPTNIPAGPVSVQAAFGGQATQSGLTVSIQ